MKCRAEEFLHFCGPDWGRAMWKNAGVGVKSELKCRAWNDSMYTKEEFMSFYGTSKGLAMWESAGVEEPGTTEEPTKASVGSQGAYQPPPAVEFFKADEHMFTIGFYNLGGPTNNAGHRHESESRCNITCSMP